MKTLVAPRMRQLPHILQKPQPAWLKQSGEAGIWYMTYASSQLSEIVIVELTMW